jgi:hypothetical protein
MPLYHSKQLAWIGIDAASGSIIYGKAGGGGLEQDAADFTWSSAAHRLSVGAAAGGSVHIGGAATTGSYEQWGGGSTAAVSAAGTGRIRYNEALNQFEQSLNGGVYTAIGGGGGGTLDDAYDFGGAGAGRSIDADSGAVTISSSAADNNNVLELSKTPVGAQSGSVLDVVAGANVTDPTIVVNHGSPRLASIDVQTGNVRIGNNTATLGPYSKLTVSDTWGEVTAGFIYVATYSALAAYKTTVGAYNGTVYGVLGGATLDGANTQDWTAGRGIIGVGGGWTLQASAVPVTVTGAAALSALTSSVGANVTLTNAYGLYINDQTGGTNNYGVYIESPVGGTINAHLAMRGSTSGDLRQSVPAVVTGYQIVWPAAQGAPATVLTNDGAGNLSWAAAASGLTIGDPIAAGAANSVLYEDAGNLLAESASFTYDGADAFQLGNLYLDNGTDVGDPELITAVQFQWVAYHGASIDNVEKILYDVRPDTFAAFTYPGGVGSTLARHANMVVASVNLQAVANTLTVADTYGLFVEGGPLAGARVNVTRPWSAGFAQAVEFRGALAQKGATSGWLTHTVPAVVTDYTVVWPAAQGAPATVLTNDGAGNLSWGVVSTADELVKVSANDTTAGYLNGKLVAGSGVTLTEQNDGANETLEVAINTTTAQGDYIHAALSGDQLNPAIGDTVDFDTAVTQRGGVTVDGSGRFSTLKAGRTYLLDATLGLSDTSSGSLRYRWYNVTAAAYIGSTAVTVLVTSSSHVSSQPTATAVITPTEDTEVELRVTDKFSTPDVLTESSWARIIEIGAVQAQVTGGLEYMDTIEVASDQTTVTFGAGGDGILGRALDGDADHEYQISFYLPDAGASGTNFDLHPNGIATNQYGSRQYGGTSNGGDNNTALRVALSESGCISAGFVQLQAETGRQRIFDAVEAKMSSGTRFDVRHTGAWTDTSTNITTLDITASVASHIKTGARFVLWRRTRNNLRADSASTYERHVEAVVAQGTNAETEYTTGHATFQGSAIGVSVSLEDTVTAGTITVNLKVAGSTVLTAVLDTTNTAFNRAIDIPGVYPISPGDEIVVGIATNTLTTTGGGNPGITVNATFVNDALLTSTTGLLDTQNTYTKAQTVAPSALSYGANIALDASLSNVFTVTLAGVTAQLDNPTNLTDGQTIVIRVTQDGVGGRALTFDTNWDFGADGAPDLTTEGIGALSLITGVSDGTKVFASAKLGFVA